MSKLKLFIVTISTILFLLSLWVVPAVMVWMSICVVDAMWLRIVLGIGAVIWLLIFRPWDMFRKDYRNRMLTNLKKSINAIIN